MDTIGPLPVAARQRRRLHSDEFKADAIAAASQPGVSMASVALTRGINANLLRRWVRAAEVPPAKMPIKTLAKTAAAAPAFVPVQLAEPSAAASEIRIDVRRGAMTITVAWPMSAAAECAGWMRELLR